MKNKKKKNKSSIAARIMKTFSFMSAIIIIGLVFAFVVFGMNIFKEIFDDSTGESLKSNAKICSDWFNDKKDELEIYSRNSYLRSGNFTDGLAFLKEEIDSKRDFYDIFFIADKEGNYSTTLREDAGNISDRDYFKEVMSGRTVISEPLISKSTGLQVAVVAAPIRNDMGEIIGLVAGNLNLVKLYNMVREFKIDTEGSYSYIVDKNGKVITHPDRSMIMQEYISIKSAVVNDEVVLASKKILARKSGKSIYKFNGIKSYVYFQEINELGWRLILKVPMDYIEKYYERIRWGLVIFVAIGILISVFTGYIISKKISEPIIELSNMFQKAAQGDLLVRAKSISTDEIGSAMKHFNIMMDKIRKMTYQDPLTELPNKSIFNDRVEIELEHRRRSGGNIAIATFDIDRFKEINRNFGHEVGDRVIKEFGKRLFNCSKGDAFLSHVSGGEFIMIMLDSGESQRLVGKIELYKDVISRVWDIEGSDYYLTASIGVAIYPKDGEKGYELIKNSQAALNRVKNSGGNDYQFYSEQLNEELVKKIEMERYMRKGIENNEFYIDYQPFVNVCTGMVTGMEALVRWRNHAMGLVGPVEFIPIAEENGYIVELGEWVMRKACEFQVNLEKMGISGLKVACNVSVIQFDKDDFIYRVKRIIDETGIDPKNLEIEITESLALGNTEEKIIKMKVLKEYGINIALDDFGSGYSSLAYLRQFPVNTLKIDRAFIKDIGKDDEGMIASTIIAVGCGLGMKITAEGVETLEQYEFIRKNNVDMVQGYYFSKPVNEEGFVKFVKKVNFREEDSI